MSYPTEKPAQPQPSSIVPETEIARRMRVRELIGELEDLSVPAHEALEIVYGAKAVESNETAAWNKTLPMWKLIQRLWDEAPKMTDASGNPDPTQAPAVEVHLVLRGQVQPLHGSLSVAPGGMLRLLTPVEMGDARNKKSALLEQFFEVGDIQTLMIAREVKTSGSPLIVRG